MQKIVKEYLSAISRAYGSEYGSSVKVIHKGANSFQIERPNMHISPVVSAERLKIMTNELQNQVSLLKVA